jgi:hypothetical protein
MISTYVQVIYLDAMHTRTSSPMTGILIDRPKLDMLPHRARGRIGRHEIVAIEFNLIITLRYQALIVGQDTIIGQEGWDHVDEIRPELEVLCSMGDGYEEGEKQMKRVNIARSTMASYLTRIRSTLPPSGVFGTSQKR